MSLPHLPAPPRFPIVDKDGMLTPEARERELRLWRKLGEYREIPSESIVPNGIKNITNDATADSIDAGTSATVRVYGTGGVGSSWSRYRNKILIATHAAVSFTGKAYETRYYMEFNILTGVWTISTTYRDVIGDNSVQFSVKTVASGGGGGVSGGGGSGSGGSGGVDSGGGSGYGLVL